MIKRTALAAIALAASSMMGSTAVLADEGVYNTHPVTGASQMYRNLFRLRCSSCHGANGEGTNDEYPKLGPALKGNPFILNAPTVAIVNVIRLGRAGRQRLYHETFPNMPAFGVEMVPDADGLADFLKNDLQK